MGTRGFVGFLIDGDIKAAYNHWDSYPSGIGLDVLEWARRAGMKVGPAMEHVKQLARELQPVDDTVPPTPEQIYQLEAWTDLNVSERSTSDWYCLLRRTQGDIGAILTAGYFEDAGDFMYDSLFCEWGYLVDLDSWMLVVYKGFQNEPHTAGRFAAGQTIPGRYYPVAEVAAWPLNDLPTREAFLAELDPEDDE